MAKSKSILRRINVYINNKQTGSNIKDIGREYAKAKNELNKLTIGSEAYNRKMKEVKNLRGVLDTHRRQISGVGGAWKAVKAEVARFGAVALTFLAGQQILQGFNNLIGRNAELSDSLADVRKTTGMTAAEVDELYKRLGNINTRTSRKELLDLAKVAGKLGKTGVKDVAAFVQVADKINVALGEDLGDIDTVIKSLGKLNEVFRVTDKMAPDEALNRTGSAINELGANSTASEPFLVDFASRLGPIAKQANITLEETLGLAAALDVLGQRSETSSTALGVFLVDMFKDTATFAEIAGLGVAEFSQLLEEDANEALIKVLEGVNGNNEGFEVMVKKLEAVGVEGSRGSQVISALANNTDLLRQQQDLANRSFAEGTSLTEEFAVKNNNLAGNLAKVQRYLMGKFVNSGLVRGLEKLVEYAAELTEVSPVEELRREQIELNALVKSIVTFNGEQAVRQRLIDELVSKYPELNEQINVETASNEQLLTALKDVNQQYERRMQLAFIGEQEKKAQKEAQKAFDDYYKRIVDLQTSFQTTGLSQGLIGDELPNIFKQVENEIDRLQMGLARGRLDVWDPIGGSTTIGPEAIERRLEAVKEFQIFLQQQFNPSLDESNQLAALTTMTYTDQADQFDELARKAGLYNKGTMQISSNLRDLNTLQKEYKHAVQESMTIANAKVEMQQKFAEEDVNAQDKVADKEEETTKKVVEGNHKKTISTEEYTDRTADLLLQLEELKISLMEDEQAREEAMLKFKHAQDVEEVKQTVANEQVKQDLLLLMEENLQKKLLDIRKKYNQAERAEDRAARNSTIQEHQAAIQQITDFQNEIRRMQNEQRAIEREKAKEEYVAFEEWKTNSYRQNAAEFEAVVLQGVSTIAEGIGQIRQLEIQAQTTELENWYAKERQLIDQQLSAKQISEEQYQKSLAQLDKKKQQRERKALREQAEADKRANIFRAIINTASAVANTIATVPWPVNLIMAPIISGLGIMQVQKIRSTPIPEFAVGGFTSGMGFRDDTGHEVAGVVHDNEWVAPEWMVNDTFTGNIIRSLESIRANKLADGGHVSKSSTPTPSFTGGADMKRIEQVVAMNAQAIQSLNSTLARGIKAHTIWTERDLRELEEMRDEYTARQDGARIS